MFSLGMRNGLMMVSTREELFKQLRIVTSVPRGGVFKAESGKQIELPVMCSQHGRSPTPRPTQELLLSTTQDQFEGR